MLPASTTNPNSSLRMSATARAAMRDTERVMHKFYNDMGENRGNCTWGIGFFVHKGVCTPEELSRKVSASSIDIEYEKRIAEVERRIKANVHVQLSQSQFDALASFTYNTTNLTNSRVYEALNAGDFARAAQRMSEAVKVRVGNKWKLAPGLVRRRQLESAPFRGSQQMASSPIREQ